MTPARKFAHADGRCQSALLAMLLAGRFPWTSDELNPPHVVIRFAIRCERPGFAFP